jgi:hypothetical protein
MKNRNTKSIGQESEAKVLVALLSRGYSVCIPFGDNERYDLIIDYGNVFLRMQVKTGRIKDGAIRFQACSHTGSKPRQDYRGQCELFGVYERTLDKVYIVPVDDIGIREGSLRIEPSKNKQSQKIRWAKDYEI